MTMNRNEEAAGMDPAALDWALRTADPGFDDWDGFTLWLEGDPTRSDRYDAIVAALAETERDLAATPPVLPPAPSPAAVPTRAASAFPASTPGYAPNGRPSRRRGVVRWSGAAMATALLGSVGLGLWTDRARPYVVETAAGRSRTIDLGDGSRLELAGGTRVRLDRTDRRVASLEAGEALFHVRHDADRPFRVAVGTVELTDIGTVFDVRHAPGGTRVAVAEGAVMVDPRGASVRLDPGQTASIRDGRIVRGAVDPADVGGWRQGRLAFDDAPLSDVAADLSRHMGVRVTAASAVAGRRFRGTIDLPRLRDDPALLGALLGVRVRTEGSGWVLEAPR